MKGGKKLNSSKDIFQLSQICVRKLESLKVDNVQTILIENQPALKNPIMKTVQMIIYTYFIINGVMKDDSPIQFVHMVNARNKLKVYKGEPIPCPKKGKYAQNKWLSVEYTRKMITDDDEDKQALFTSSKKKDDLADAYLQGIYWIDKSI